MTKSREYIKFTINTKRTYIKLYGKEKARDKLSKIAFETSNGKDAKNYFVQDSIFYSNKKSPMRYIESNKRRKRERDKIEEPKTEIILSVCSYPHNWILPHNGKHIWSVIHRHKRHHSNILQ